ncbi:BMP family lipoprotein [Romboutsia lituseburensis]|uniref:BMP family lipoprotein n=1 Tax=Romboutsia lituseburensis TaxID=1537 RepID=UPI00215AD7E3|nr:BMP family ABC transporter substrate-binding protein [Romboutsia lituseburensis]MCR8746432.1 BMP family ABC transporter substrate-binding protein [Romboutsia lituseburensis]
MLNHYKKIVMVILITIVAIFIITSSTKYNETNLNNLFTNSTSEKKKVAIIFSTPGLGDKSFNDLCYDGALKAQEDLGVEFDYSEPKSEDDYEKICRDYAQSQNYELIISIGLDHEESVSKVSKEFLNQKFSIIDSKIELPNVSSIYTNWPEQTFLNGVMAGLITKYENTSLNKSNSLGVILGRDMQHLSEGAIGFEAGAKYVNPDINIIVGVVDDFANPAKAKEIALSMYSKGVRYIQHIAGESGLGVFAAAKEADKYAFGIDDNQNLFEPNHIVSTATRYANEIVYNEIKSITNDTWKDGVHKFGIKENIIGYTTKGSNVDIPPGIIEVVEEIKTQIIEEKIKIPSNKSELEKWVKENQYKN